jgi:hypothetical protein
MPYENKKGSSAQSDHRHHCHRGIPKTWHDFNQLTRYSEAVLSIQVAEGDCRNRSLWVNLWVRILRPEGWKAFMARWSFPRPQ